MEKNLASAVLPKRLQKTSAEQAILKNVQELEQELSECTEPERSSQLTEQVSLLKEQLARLHGPDYEQLRQENLAFKEKIARLEREAEAMHSAPACLSAVQGPGARPNERNLKLNLYHALLNKYKDEINKLENKTVGEIKAMVNPDDLSIRLVLQDFKPKDYDFGQHYPSVMRLVYEFVTSEINYVNSDLDINFWLSPAEILAEKVGDDEDLAVFLCSLLYALGDENAEVVIAELDDLTTHAFVITELAGRFVLLDPSQKRGAGEFSGTRKDVMSRYEYNGAKIKRFLYRFNRNRYEQFI